MTDGESNTLARRGLEESFFQLCCCVSFLFWQEIGFGCTYSLCNQSATTESYIRDTRAKLETPLEHPIGGPEESYYEPQGMLGMSSGRVASNWYRTLYSNPPRNRRPTHTHTIQLRCCVSFFGSGGKQFLERTYLVYNKVVRLCQFFCCGGKDNLLRIFLLNPRIFFLYFLLCMDLQPQSHDCISKISRTLFHFLNNTCLVSLFQRNNSLIFQTGVPCFSVTLFYTTLLALTDRRND